LVVSIYSLLWSVKTLVPDPLKSQLKQWQETARNASINKKKTIQPRLLSKYSFIIWAQLGILLGYYYSHHDSAIAFPNESCLDPPVLMNAIYRYFFGVVGIACIVPIAIISIPGVKAKDVQIGLVSILLGLWVAYGNAKVSNHLGLSCSNK
jgi:hypothetical protein